MSVKYIKDLTISVVQCATGIHRNPLLQVKNKVVSVGTAIID